LRGGLAWGLPRMKPRGLPVIRRRRKIFGKKTPNPETFGFKMGGNAASGTGTGGPLVAGADPNSKSSWPAERGTFSRKPTQKAQPGGPWGTARAFLRIFHLGPPDGNWDFVFKGPTGRWAVLDIMKGFRKTGHKLVSGKKNANAKRTLKEHFHRTAPGFTVQGFVRDHNLIWAFREKGAVAGGDGQKR